jgi:hypothetical protein
MRKTLATLVSLAAAPLMAQDACPTAEDLVGGITFELAEGATETYRDAGNSVIEVIYEDKEGYRSRTQLGKGLYLLEIIDLEGSAPLPDTRTTYAHIFKPADMPPPQPEMVWASQVTTTGNDGLGQEVQDHRGGALSLLTVGRCRYETFRVTVTYDDDENSVDTLQYLPALGFALLTAVAYDENEGKRVDDVFSYIGISAASGTTSAPKNSGSSGRKVRTGD